MTWGSRVSACFRVSAAPRKSATLPAYKGHLRSQCISDSMSNRQEPEPSGSIRDPKAGAAQTQAKLESVRLLA